MSITPEAPKHNPYIDGPQLIRSKHSSRARFEKLVARYRLLGIPDRDIVRAMMEAPNLVDAIGGGVRRS